MSISRRYCKKTLGSIIIAVVLASVFIAAINIRVIPPAKADANWLDGWLYRKKITIDHTKVTANLTDFPILVNISDSDLATHAQSNGYDIAFTNNSVNKLSHEVELYKSGSGRLIAWVKMPSLSLTVDTVLYMYYGNPSATNQQDVTGTWGSNYAIVQHLKEPLGTLHDSTSYNNDGTPYGGVSQNITGKIDGAASFDGSNDYVDCGNKLVNFGTGDFTISLWLSAPAQAADYTGILKRLDYVNEAVYTVRCGGSYTGSNKAALQFAVVNSSTGVWRYLDIPNVLNGQWHYAVGLRDGDAWSVYIDGVLAKSTTGAGSINVNTPNQLLIGVHKTNYYNGKVDEIRLSKTAKSASWISTEYNNQNSPSTFYNVGSEEAPQGPPTVSNPSPADGITEVPTSLSKLSFSLTDVNSDLINYVVTTSPNIGSGSGTGVADGRYYVSVSGLQPNTAYTWRVDATDPAGSGQLTTVTFSFRTSGFQGQSWLVGWQYRKSHVITAATGAGTGYQTRVKVTFSTSSPTWFTVLPTNIPVFTTTDVSSNGTVFAGDMNYQVYKSTDSGVTFSKIFTIPAQSNPWGAQAGMVYTVFVDSRDYLLISAGSTNRLYRSTNGGTSFTEVLNLNRPSNDGTLISMTEDASGDLYAAEYANVPQARLWKSTDGGATWSWLRNWDARHLHTVKFNSYNRWLYVIVGENSNGTQTEYQTVWRSKDGGSSWQLIIARGSGTDTKYSPIEFIGNGVYLGQDRNGQYDTNLIQKIADDGVSEPFTPVTVYNNPYPSAIMPGPGATKLNDTIIFTTSSESYTATCQVVMSKDGSNWTVLNTQTVSTTYRWINELTIHPRKGIVYGCINGNYAYFIASPSTPRPPPLQAPPDTVFAEGHCKTDFGDIRFTDDDGITLLDYWMETKTDGDTAIFWVKVADDLSSFNRTIYVYYGKSDATTTSNHDNTFLFFDGFNADLSKWTILSGSWTIESGNLTIQPPVGSGNNYLVTKSTFATSNIAIRTKMRSIQAGTTQAHVGMIWHANNLTGTSHRNDQVFFRPHSTGPTQSGNIQPAYYDGAGPYSGMWFYSDKKGSYYNWETWYTVEVRIPTSGNIELSGNDVYWYDWDNQQFANNRVGLVAHEGGKDYFDYIAIRKYVTPEPSHGSWGGEEQSQCSLTLNVDGGGSIEENPNQVSYTYGTVVTLTAHADAGWAFAQWSDDAFGGANPTTVTMDGNKIVTATFTQNVYTLSVSVSPVGSGSVDLDNAGPYHYGDVVQLTALPAAGWSFDHWTGALMGSANPATLVMTNDFSLTASFARPTLEISPSLTEKSSGDVGTAFDVYVTVENIADLYGFDFNITWDGTLLACSGYDTSNLGGIWSGTHGWYEVDARNGSGWFKYAATSLDNGYNGSHELFKITFRVKGCNSVRQTTIGFATHKMSSSIPSQIVHSVDEGLYRITGNKPTLSISPTDITCRKYGELFTAAISISDAENVLGLEFDVRFNTTLLNYTSVAWNAWSSGSMVSDEAGGKLTGSTSGSAKSGSLTLLTITFKVALLHIWKDDATMSWKSNQTGTIFFQAANLTYTIAPKLRYTKGGLDEITVTPAEANYKFAPIKGDLDNNGKVEIEDLSTFCHYYDVKDGDADWNLAEKYDLIMFDGEKILDIYDIIIMTSNYGCTYP